MTWYAVYRTADGSLASSGSSIAPTLPAGMAVKSFPAKPAGMLWNPATLDYDLPTPPPVQVIPASEFLLRFTSVERIGIRAAVSAGDAIAEDFLGLLNVSQTVTLGSATVTQGLAYLEQAGLIAPGRAAVIGG